MSFTCTGSTVCIFNTGYVYDDVFLSGGTYNGYNYYTGITSSYFIYFSTGVTENLWCLSSSLGGTCDQFGPLNSFSVCPDFWDGISLVASSSGACPTTTTTTTSPCDVFDFDAIFDCIVPTTTTTTSATTTTTTTTTIPPDLCSGVSISYSAITYTTTTTTFVPTTTTTTTINRKCIFDGIVTFNIFDEYMRCGNTKVFKDCFNGFEYYTSEVLNLIAENTIINQGVVYKIQINTLTNSYTTCATFLGLADNISGIDNIKVLYEIGLEKDGACLECPPPQTTTTSTSTSTTTTTTTEAPCILNEYHIYNGNQIGISFEFSDCTGNISGVINKGDTIILCSATTPVQTSFPGGPLLEIDVTGNLCN